MQFRAQLQQLWETNKLSESRSLPMCQFLKAAILSFFLPTFNNSSKSRSSPMTLVEILHRRSPHHEDTKEMKLNWRECCFLILNFYFKWLRNHLFYWRGNRYILLRENICVRGQPSCIKNTDTPGNAASLFPNSMDGNRVKYISGFSAHVQVTFTLYCSLLSAQYV